MKYFIVFAALVLTACTSYGPPRVPVYPQPMPPVNVVDTGGYCGGMLGVVCGQPQDFCRMDVSAQCGAADQMGVCSPRPQMCTRDYRPVCGCDGRTYSNECTANSAGVSAAYMGECRN